MFPDLKADIERYTRNTRTRENIYLLFEQGIWAIGVYRFARWVRTIRIPIVSTVLKIIAFIFFKLIEICTGISLPASAQIGKGLYIGHFGSIIVHSDAKIGEQCSLGPGVIIGTRGLGSIGVPVIGHNVYIGVGAKLLGAIKIGNNVKIGANAVVLKDVPNNATVVGVAATIIEKAVVNV